MENLSIWAKSIALAVIIVSILEMLLPNNKTKKYIKMVMGIFILYNIISPFIKDKSSISFAEVNLDNYTKSANEKIEINQESMDKRLEELYIDEIEKDITKKIEKKGYVVKSCKVKAKITEDENKTGITKIALKLEKSKNHEEKSIDLENQLVTQIQKIKKIDTNISEKVETEVKTDLEKNDIQNIKKFLIEEYEVNEKCLEIN